MVWTGRGGGLSVLGSLLIAIPPIIFGGLSPPAFPVVILGPLGSPWGPLVLPWASLPLVPFGFVCPAPLWLFWALCAAIGPFFWAPWLCFGRVFAPCAFWLCLVWALCLSCVWPLGRLFCCACDMGACFWAFCAFALSFSLLPWSVSVSVLACL